MINIFFRKNKKFFLNRMIFLLFLYIFSFPLVGSIFLNEILSLDNLKKEDPPVFSEFNFSNILFNNQIRVDVYSDNFDFFNKKVKYKITHLIRMENKENISILEFPIPPSFISDPYWTSKIIGNFSIFDLNGNLIVKDKYNLASLDPGKYNGVIYSGEFNANILNSKFGKAAYWRMGFENPRGNLHNDQIVFHFSKEANIFMKRRVYLIEPLPEMVQLNDDEEIFFYTNIKEVENVLFYFEEYFPLEENIRYIFAIFFATILTILFERYFHKISLLWNYFTLYLSKLK